MQKKTTTDTNINLINPDSPLRPAKKGQQSMEEAHLNGLALFLCILFILLGTGFSIYMDEYGATTFWTVAGSIALILAGMVTLYSLRIARQWEKAVVLRLGKFHTLRGPGLFWLMPLIDSVSIWVDQRVMVTPFSAEKTLTRDTVPVNVDAVLFWVVWDAEKAALEVANYQVAIAWAAQTALREIIGQMTLADILIGRAKMDADLQKIIDERTTPWGITVQSVEIRDVIIPQDLEDAMSRQAQAERERQSRIILGESEKQIASSFAQASEAYIDNPTALHLRAMNMLFEGLKQKGALVIVPSSAVDTMNLGGLSGMISLAQNAQEKREE
ncbi:protein containg SPFH domain [Longilinea arvoryzae]|uniref:Protein containg SPFH domain n=1 Tax=Longilinea arvoryzae TaxID=360412 RepID=A0A0S7BEF4_9CHLR|nr:slipin family protein [Longilinea arvoryzae]GAP12883.1 protein containg SPFH domain [Longilinea arvoryzae]